MAGTPSERPNQAASSPPLRVAEIVRSLEDGRAARLPDVDLLGFLLGPRTGRAGHTAARALLEPGGWPGLVEAASGGGLGSLGRTRVARLAASLEVARRLVREEGGGLRPALSTPRDVFEITADLRHRRREHFVGLYLNTRNRLLARETVSVGSLNASIVHPREVFEPALRLGAAGLIVVHNHPSGETDPSEDDLRITARLREAGEILGIDLLDHVIVGSGGFTSLKERP